MPVMIRTVMAREGVPSTTCLRPAKEAVDARPSPSMTNHLGGIAL
jgi:hypothetical protein